MDNAALDEARARVKELGGAELLERLEHLDRRVADPCARRNGDADLPPTPDDGTALDFDVVVAGGGLSLLLVPLLADRGLRVAVCERGRAGVVHREWNVSAAELQPLVEGGLFRAEELPELMVASYRHGICRWHGGGTYPVTGVLDCAIDATRLLAETRRRAEARGVCFFDYHEVVGQRAGSSAIAVRVRPPTGASRELIARLFVDARGAASPAATADLLCPTVGGVLSGLAEGAGPDEVDPGIGEILVTTEHVVEGRQHIWELFPGRAGHATVYAFYYARREDVAPGALLRLYARFWQQLPGYKRGAAQLVRPTFGYIPGWSRLGPGPAPQQGRTVLFGDVAARHSPLTFCGFGAMLRAIVPGAQAIAAAIDRDDRSGRPLASVIAEAPIHGGTGALSRLIATPPRASGQAHELNALLDAAFGTLHALGNEAYAALLRDEMTADDFLRFLLATARRRPRVYLEVVRQLGLRDVGRWSWQLTREALQQRGGGR